MLKEIMQKFVKTTQIEIAPNGLEDDSSERTSTCKVTLVNPISTVGSGTTEEGHPIKIENATTARVNGNLKNVLEGTETESDLAKLLAGCKLEKRGDKEVLVYKGTELKWDVSRPKFRYVNGVAQPSQPPRLWVVSIAFDRLAGNLRADRLNANREALKNYYNGGVPAGANAPAGPQVVQ